MSNIGELLSWAQKQLNSDQATTDAHTLLTHVTGKDRSWLFAWPEKKLSPTSTDRFRSLVHARAKGTPVAYLTGNRSFWTLDLKVGPDTLIPRPETEHLVERALRVSDDNKKMHVLDLGTGSGAIALAIASERPHWQITAVDFSEAALMVARKNALGHDINNVAFLHSNWFSQVEGLFDLIVSNPPYIAEQDDHLSQGDLRFEPRAALASGINGMDDIRLICGQAHSHLSAGGWLMFEHGFEQGQTSRDLLKQNDYLNIFTLRDLAGLERLSGGQKRS